MVSKLVKSLKKEATKKLREKAAASVLIFVQMGADRVACRCEARDTISFIQKMICDTKGIIPGHQILSYHGHILTETKTLASYGIAWGETIRLTVLPQVLDQIVQLGKQVSQLQQLLQQTIGQSRQWAQLASQTISDLTQQLSALTPTEGTPPAPPALLTMQAYWRRAGVVQGSVLLMVALTDSIDEVKDKFTHATGMVAHSVYLERERMVEGRTLADYNFEEGDLITVTCG
jgi:hypothetical protein